MGIKTPDTCKHLGLHLGKSIEDTMKVTMRNTEPKRIKRRILGTTPPTDILHRALLINTALIPIYNHIFMALPVQKETMKRLHQEILDFLWTKQQDGETIQKRRLFTNSLPVSTKEGSKSLIQLTLLKDCTSTCSKKYKTKHDSLTDIPPPTSQQY
jgi:hypothetical protein